MATVTGYTAERMKAIEDDAIIDGVVSGNNLILTRHDGRTINAGNVKGPQGATGPSGGVSTDEMTLAIALASNRSGKGIMAHNLSDADQVLTGFHEDDWRDVTGSVITFTPFVGRYYDFSAQLGLSSEGTDTLFDTRILHIGGATIAQQTILLSQADRVAGVNLNRVREAPAGWDEPLSFRLQVRVNNAFTARVKGTSISTVLSVTDVGDLP